MKFLVCIFVVLASVAQAQGLRDVAIPDAPGLVPVAGDAAWRSHVQLVWNPVERVLVRRSYRIHDPYAAAGYDLFWQPRDPSTDQSGTVTGDGVLTWRAPGSFRHGKDGIIAQYIGTMVAGQPEGFGRYTDASGLRYTGTWVAGLMDGTGHLINANGDAYTGGFAAGVPHGPGVLIDVTGLRHDGLFAAGLPDGPGLRATPDGEAFASVWRAGAEQPGQRTDPMGQIEKVQSSGAQGLAIALSVGGENRFCCQLEGAGLGYAAISEAGKFSIFPDDPLLLDQWRGRSNVVIADAVGFDWTRAEAFQYSFLNYDSDLEITLPLRFGLRNATTRGVDIAGAYLEVDRSRVDNQPMIQSVVLKPLTPQNTDFSIENYGWATATNATLTAAFVNGDAATSTFTIDLPDVADVQAFSFAPLLRDFGVDVGRMPDVATLCAGVFGQESNPAGCTDRIRDSGIFGGLSAFLTEDATATHYGLNFVGTLTYDWQDSDGQRQQTRAPFEGHLPLAALWSRAECEGGDFEEINMGIPFDLEMAGGNYRINLPVFAHVQAGEERRWEVLLDAEKSSNHDMRLVVQLADGRRVVSRDIAALIYNPRRYSADIRPFEPRC